MLNITDIGAVLFLVVLEGLLSFDNALALAAMVRHLPEQQRKKALTYGMFGAFAFRALSLLFISFLMRSVWVKILGSAYLLYLCFSFFFSSTDEKELEGLSAARFWRTVVMVELTDIAFSVDSILAAVAVSSNVYVVITGGILGIIAMRFVSSFFLTLIDYYPDLVKSAYLLVGIVGLKLLLEVALGVDFHGPWAFPLWSCMLCSLACGFIRRMD